jgi:uncharacterized protein (DUF1778 family)
VLETRYTISFDLREPPGNGKAQIVFRCMETDRNVVTAAAKLLGISVNRFMRSVVVQAAHQVLREAGGDTFADNDTRHHFTETVLPPGVKPTQIKP